MSAVSFAAQHAMCTALGWPCLPSAANYFCARPDESCAPRMQALRAADIQLRGTASFRLARHVRLGVPPPASQSVPRRAWRAAGA